MILYIFLQLWSNNKRIVFSSGKVEGEANEKSEPNRVHKPHPKRYIRKIDCSHSLHGGILGLIILVIAVVTLSMFYGMKEVDTEEESQEMEISRNLSESADRHREESTHHNNMNTGVKVWWWI